MDRELRLDEVAREGLTQAKVVSMAVLGLSALICSLLPVWVTRWLGGLRERHLLYLDLFLRLGGGVLLATTFLHLLPDVREDFDKLQSSWPDNTPELIMCLGFFLMYAVEEVAHACIHSAHSHQHKEEGHSHVVEGPLLRGVLIIIALSIHQVFEGLAIGLRMDTAGVWVLLGAVAAHKIAIAFCVGAEIANSRSSVLTSAICVTVFAIATPIGIGVGLALTAQGEADRRIDVASTVLQGLATGTLLYVVFFEVLSKSPVSKGLVHFVSTFVGFLIMLALLLSLSS